MLYLIRIRIFNYISVNFISKFIFVSLVVLFTSTQSAAQVASFQFVNTSEMLTADIYVNGVLLADNLSAGTATPYLELTGAETHIALAPAGSLSVADSLITAVVNSVSGEYYSIVVLDDAGQPKLKIFSGLKSNSNSPDSIDMAFLHAAPGVPALNVVIRETGTMVVGDLPFGGVSVYSSYLPGDYYFDVKDAATASIISTYRIATQANEGDALSVIITGSSTSSTSLKLWLVSPDDGFVHPVDFAPIARVHYINVASETLDIYKNGTIFSNDATPGLAMPYKNIPADLPMSIAFCPAISTNPSNAYGFSAFTFENNKTYVAVSSGVVNSALYPLTMSFWDGAQEASTDANKTSVLFFNGSHLHPTLKIQEAGTEIFAYTDYTHFDGYKVLSGSVHTLDIVDSGNNLLGSFTLSLDTLFGKSITLYSRNSEVNGGLELWMTTAQGYYHRLYPATVKVADFTTPLSKYHVFPNPLGEAALLYFKADGQQGLVHQYQLCDLTGSIIHEGDVSSDGSGVLDLNGLGCGIYFLHLKAPNQQKLTFKIIR